MSILPFDVRALAEPGPPAPLSGLWTWPFEVLASRRVAKPRGTRNTMLPLLVLSVTCGGPPLRAAIVASIRPFRVRASNTGPTPPIRMAPLAVVATTGAVTFTTVIHPLAT